MRVGRKESVGFEDEKRAVVDEEKREGTEKKAKARLINSLCEGGARELLGPTTVTRVH